MHWFSADEHYNHMSVVTKFIFRPFKSVEEMNAELIRRHNERVKPNHTVWHLGDFKFSSNGPNFHEIVGMLNGHHVFLDGNHDRNNG